MNNGIFLQKLKICTYPFNSYYSFKNTDYLKQFFYEDEIKKEKILKSVFDEIREGFYTTKLDSLKSISNIYWKEIKNYKYIKREKTSEYTPEDYYYDICEMLSNKYFDLKNGQLLVDGINKTCDKELEVGDNYNHKFQWYLLKHMMDMDTLIGAFLVSNRFTHKEDMSLWDSPIFTTDTLLETMLDKGVAELHMHVGATKRFSSIWTWMMNDIGTKEAKGKTDAVLKKIVISTCEGQIVLEHYIKAAKIMRLIMGKYLMAFKDTEFKNFISDLKKDTHSEDSIYELFEKFKDGERLDKNTIYYKNLMDKLRKYFELTYEPLNRNCKDNNQYLNNVMLGEDILTYVFDDFYRYNDEYKNIIKLYNFEGTLLPEKVFIFKSMKYINDCRIGGKNIIDFEKCFWQYIKVKNMVYKYIVQQHTGGKGLDIFTGIYKRQSSIKISNFMEEALYSQIKNQNIKKLEIRMGIQQDEEKFKLLLIKILEVYRNFLDTEKSVDNIPLLGIVFHFNKKEDVVSKGKCIYHYMDDKDLAKVYFGKIENDYLEQAKLIAKIRREFKGIDNYIVGIDAASKENATEPFVFKKAYEELRKNENIGNGYSRGGFVKQIGYTFHVGEEYRDIVSGLRHIDEVIELLNFKAGDRLGHAIVLGIDMYKWSEINPVVYINAQEYLDNLLWEWGLYIENEEYKNIENINFLENKILDAVEYIFGFSDSIRVRDLYKSYRYKLERKCDFDNPKDKECKLKCYTKRKYHETENKIEDIDTDEIQWTPKLICNAINCEYFLKDMKKTVTININRDTIEKYIKLQKYMKDKVNKKGIIVETNPTSNLLIGDFTTFKDYHITNLSSPKKEDVIITINTDDPVIFNTRINNEYALIYDILMKEGKYSGKEVINWLDKVRDNGIQYSFIKDRKLTKEEIKEELQEIINKLKK